ncbi:hypothetical protein FQA39_LY10987 [Lamprigera yunnana]|nr:hypothetical protein FQA39_LY10987 [Lamprigera yunnana]
MAYLRKSIVFLLTRRFSDLPKHSVEDVLQRSTQLTTYDADNTGIVAPENENRSVLDDCTEDISHVATYLKPTFNFAAYVNKSETLQELVKLNVNLSVLEKNKKAVPYVLGLNFERDVKNHVIWLSKLGINNVGGFLTRNPFILQEDLDNLQVRINYLKSKRFTDEMIISIISRNAYWLMYSTEKMDEKLGFFQKEFGLTGREVRGLAVKQPRLITYSLKHVKLNMFSFKEEMGFTPEEMKSILLKKPNLFMKLHVNLLKTFEYLHKDMKIPIERIAEVPEVLTCRLFRLQQRHLFLKSLDRVQYNSRQPNYVSLIALVSKTDVVFCKDVAKSSIEAYNTFLKTL